MLKAKAIVNNNTKHNSFVLAQGTLSKFFARAKLSDVALYCDNANRAALSYIDVAETNIRAPRRGIPLHGFPHKDNELINKGISRKLNKTSVVM